MTSSFTIDQAGAVIGGFLLLILLVQILKEVRVLRRRRIRDRAEGPQNHPEDPHVNHEERDQTEGPLNQNAIIPEDPHVSHEERDQTEGPLNQNAIIPEDPHVNHEERDQTEGPLNQNAIISEDPHVNHEERDQTEGPLNQYAIPEDPHQIEGPLNQYAIPEDPHQIEGPLNQYAIPEDPHVNHVERDQVTEGVPNGMLVLPDDPLMQYSTAQSHALPYLIISINLWIFMLYLGT